MKREYLQIPNWDKLQYRSDRVLPWLKLPVSLLDHVEYRELTEVQKAALISLWMLAQTLKNRIPYDLTWIHGRTNIQARTVRTLIKRGLIEKFTEASETNGFIDLAQRMGAQSAPLEGEGEEKRKDKEGEGEETAPKDAEPSRPLNGFSPPDLSLKSHRSCDFEELKRKVSVAYKVEAFRDVDSLVRNTGFTTKQVSKALEQLRADGNL